MMYRILTLICCAGLCLGSFAGCSKSKEPTDSNTEQVKTMQQYKEEAAKDINEQNMDDELDKLDQAINQEAGQQ